MALYSWASRAPPFAIGQSTAKAVRAPGGAHARPPVPTFSGASMAVQQNKKSPSKRGMHRSHNALDVPGLAVEPTTGETHLRHHISPNGFYRGRQVLKNKSEA